MARKTSGLSEAHKSLMREIIGYIREGDIATALSVLCHLVDGGSYGVTMARFEAFWSAYPRKDAQDLARWEWFKQHVSDKKLRRILAALEIECRAWSDIDFVPQAATWLRQRRWLKEQPPEEENAADKYIREHEGYGHGGGHEKDI
jgi:hypothetical protein